MVTGSQPETRTSRPAENIYQDEGAIDGKRFTLTTSMARADWILSVEPLATVNTGQLQTLGQFPDALASFHKLLDPWLSNSVTVVRLAVGAILDQVVDGKVGGYSLLQDYLPGVKLDAEATADFMYQINRPFGSKLLPGTSINRVSKWASLHASFLGVPGAGKPVKSEFDLVRLELDANTSATATGTIAAKILPDVFSELTGAAMHIASVGDRP